MSIFENFFNPKPKPEIPRPYTLKEREAEYKVSRQKETEKVRQKDKETLEEAKSRFVLERPQLEKRLWEISRRLKELDTAIESMSESKPSGEIRKILDQEFHLNSAGAMRPPNMSYEEWEPILKDSRKAVQELKRQAYARLEKYQKERYQLIGEKEEIERRIQRGY